VPLPSFGVETTNGSVGVGTRVSVGVRVGVRDGSGVCVNVGSGVGVIVLVGIGVAVGPNNCPDPQLNIAKLKSKTNIILVRCFVFIFSPALSRAHPATVQGELRN